MQHMRTYCCARILARYLRCLWHVVAISICTRRYLLFSSSQRAVLALSLRTRAAASCHLCLYATLPLPFRIRARAPLYRLRGLPAAAACRRAHTAARSAPPFYAHARGSSCRAAAACWRTCTTTHLFSPAHTCTHTRAAACAHFLRVFCLWFGGVVQRDASTPPAALHYPLHFPAHCYLTTCGRQNGTLAFGWCVDVGVMITLQVRGMTFLRGVGRVGWVVDGGLGWWRQTRTYLYRERGWKTWFGTSLPL